MLGKFKPSTIFFVSTLVLCLSACSQADDTGPSNEEPAQPGDPAEPTDPVTPLGMTLLSDDITYVGTAVIDITPVITETYSDLNNNHEFDGCFDDPAGERCAEPFDDANGNGIFDATFIGGFEPLRPAQQIGSPISTRAFVMSHNAAGTEPTRYFAWVSLDLIGLEGKRFWPIEEQFISEGFAPERLLVTATHNHQAPDTIGLWGDPLNQLSGCNAEYMERISQSIDEAVRAAAANMQPVKLSVAATSMQAQGPYYNGTKHGGMHPMENVVGMINDIRDPRIVSDRLLTLQAKHLETNATVLTLTNWSGHPEVGGGNVSAISADWVSSMRSALESQYGGTSIHLPEALGGMQSALFMDLPLINSEGVEQFEACTNEDIADPDNPFECFGKEAGSFKIDEQGNPMPQWAENQTDEVMVSHGWHIAKAVIHSLETAEPITDMYLDVDAEWLYIPVDNPIYNLIFSIDILDFGFDELINDPSLCVEPEEMAPIGCAQARAFRVRIGPVELLTAPGEVTPEIAWGLPLDDPQFILESEDVTARGPDAMYFVQHIPECNNVSFEDCSNRKEVDGCDCLKLHTSPYILSDDNSVTPYMSLSDARYKATISMTDSYFSYILPGPDIHHDITVLDSYQGDHFEDTVTFSTKFAEKVSQAHQAIDTRW